MREDDGGCVAAPLVILRVANQHPSSSCA